MEVLLAIVVGALFGSGIYLMLSRTPVKLIIGLVMLSNAINLLIFVAAGLTRGAPPLIPPTLQQPPQPTADPLPQALILTAIVISFGVLAFAMILLQRTFRTQSSEDLDDMKATDT
jgi:multicomponent Na+:H+ antiporter subunit C